MKNNNYVIIDSRMRTIEKEYLKTLGLQLIQLPCSRAVYSEISAHVDIFCVRIGSVVIAEPTVYPMLSNYPFPCICGRDLVSSPYPKDIAYNICILGNYAIHLREQTDPIVQEWVNKMDLIPVNIKQGYSKCSIAVIDENSCIVSDESIATTLRKYGIEVIVVPVDCVDIELCHEDTVSTMRGLIGGNISRVGDTIVVWGDITNYPNAREIQDWIQKKKLKLIHFPGYSLRDYGSLIEI